MIARRFAPLNRNIILLSFAWTWLLWCAPARAQNLGDNIRTAGNVGPFLPQIQLFVRERVSALGGKDSAAQSKAREELVNAASTATGGGLPPASGAFLNSYTPIINQELQRLTTNPSPRARLNAAIVVAKVAESAASGGGANEKLLPVTQALLNDESDGVLLWSLRGARHVLPVAIAQNSTGANQLITSIVQVGQNRPRVISAVYDALAIPAGSAGAGGAGRDKALNVTVPALHNVLQHRVNQWLTTLPPEPAAESRAAAYLTGRSEYAAQTTQQKVMTAQLISHLLSVVAHRASDASIEQRRELVYLVQRAGGALHVVGMVRWENSPKLLEVTRPLNNMIITTTPEEMQAYVQPVHPVLITIQKFASIPSPPKILPMSGGGESTAPSTAPAAGAQ